MKTASILAVFALASVSLAGCAIAPTDANADGSIPGSSATTPAASASSAGDVSLAPPPPVAPPAVVSTTAATPPPKVSPGTLVSCYSFDVATTSDGSDVGVCAPTTATGKPRYLRAYSILSVVSPVTGETVSIMAGIE